MLPYHQIHNYDSVLMASYYFILDTYHYEMNLDCFNPRQTTCHLYCPGVELTPGRLQKVTAFTDSTKLGQRENAHGSVQR